MASPEQIDQILDLLKKYAPEKRYREFNRTTMGAGAVLLYLSNADASVSAGQIGRFLNVSSARVAVLLKKMEGKGMITTGHPLSDARITTGRLPSADAVPSAGQSRSFAEKLRM